MYYQKYRGGNKFNARTTQYNGFSYDSKLEAGYAMELDMRKKAGEIKDVERQVRVEVNVMWVDRIPVITLEKREELKKKGIEFEKLCDLIMDFVVTHNDGTIEYFEAKGLEMPLFKQKWKLLEIATRNHENIIISVNK